MTNFEKLDSMQFESQFKRSWWRIVDDAWHTAITPEVPLLSIFLSGDICIHLSATNKMHGFTLRIYQKILSKVLQCYNFFSHFSVDKVSRKN